MLGEAFSGAGASVLAVFLVILLLVGSFLFFVIRAAVRSANRRP